MVKMVTRAVNNPGNFTIGPSDIYVGLYGMTKGEARSIGITQGGVSYNHSREYKEFDDADQYISVVGVEKIGERLEVTFSMKENTLENLALAWDLPEGNIDEATNTITFGGNYESTYRSLFIDGPAPGGGTAGWEFWKVVAYSTSEIADTKEDNALLEVTVLVIEDVTKIKGQRFGRRVDIYEDSTPPSVTAISPEDDALSAPLDSNVVWTLSEAIQQRDITTGNFNILDETGGEVVGNLSYDKASFQVSFTPESSLSASTNYFTFVSGEVRDIAGNQMGSNYRSNFSTIA